MNKTGWTLIITLLLYVVVCVVGISQVQADNWYAEVGAGYAFDTPWGTSLNETLHYDWKGSNPIATIAVGREFGKSLSVEYFHMSNWLSGFPVNDDRETGIDMVQVKYKWRW